MSLLRSKYGLLGTGEVQSEEGARSAVSDLNRFFLASLYDIQIDVLQLYLALQNDPDVVEFRQSRLREKIERYGRDFRQVLDDDRVGAYHRKLKDDAAKSGLPRLPGGFRLPGDRRLPRGLRRLLGGQLAERVEKTRLIRSDFDAVLMHIERWIEASEAATEESRRQSIVFYREPDGERALRAYHTEDVRLEQANA